MAYGLNASNCNPLKPKQGFQLILLNWGGDGGYFCGWGVCEGVGIYMLIWFGCVRRVGMYWDLRRETTPLYHICYIKFISS